VTLREFEMRNDKLADRDSVGDLLKQGRPHKEIAVLANVSPATVAKIAGELGLQTRRNAQYVVLSEDDWDDIRDRVNAGDNVTDIANDFGTSRASIYARMKKPRRARK